MKDKIIIVVGSVVIGIVLSFLYSHTVVSGPQEKFKEYNKSIDLRGDRVHVDLDLSKDLYFLKIKHIIQENQPKEIFVNGVNIDSDIYRVKKRGIIETSYAHVSKEIMRTGKNTIEIYFSGIRPPDVNLEIANYRRKVSNDIYILFSESINLPSGKFSFENTFLFVLLTVLFLNGLVYFLGRVLPLTPARLFLYEVYSLFLFIICLSCLWILPVFSDAYRIAISPSYFWRFGLISFFNIGLCIIFVRDLRNSKAFLWIKTREFSDKCAIFFMILLIICAFLLDLHAKPAVEALANIAYFLLVTGVVIKFIKCLKEKRCKG